MTVPFALVRWSAVIRTVTRASPAPPHPHRVRHGRAGPDGLGLVVAQLLALPSERKNDESFRMERLLRVLESKRVDPTLMTTHTFNFDDMERAFEVSDQKLDDVIKPLIVF
jgi:threonine dehydrogenase-like Zn-dependent dehydrogenase